MSSQGSILARVYTSDAYLPLRDAPVTFTRTLPDGGRELLALRLTDASGLTVPLVLETPEAVNSLTPDSPVLPYATINLHVEYPGYNALMVEGIQVFPGIETIQGLQLRPLSISQYQFRAPTVYGPSSQNL